MSRVSLPTLEVRGVRVCFGGVIALRDVSLKVEGGMRYGIIGPNGAGKTTLFNVVTGFIFPDRGQVFINGTDVTRLAPHRRARLGLARTFQITTLFLDLTALENVMMGAMVTVGHHRSMWRSAHLDRDARALAEALLCELGIGHLAYVPVREMAYGQQRQLEIAVALSTNPRILLLDEPTAGLSAVETRAVCQLIRGLRKDLTVVIIEHDLDVIFDLADHVTVLHNGSCIADGPADTVREDPVVKEVYLGGWRRSGASN